MSNKITPPFGYDFIQTEDGSYTFYSKMFDENCHSLSGAQSETVKYFIEDSKLINCNEGALIFEVGFGLGLGLREVIKFSKNNKKSFRFVSTEIDPILVSWFCDQFPEDIQIIQKNATSLKAKTQFLDIEVLIGDARKTTPLYFKNTSKRIDRIFQDAFSPKKNPTLWEKPWFEDLFSYSNQGCILTTYSASHSVKENLTSVGFNIEKIEGHGKKRAATRAWKK